MATRPIFTTYMLRRCLNWISVFAVAGSAFATPTLAARGHELGFVVGWGVSDGKSELQTCHTQCKPGIAGAGKGQFAAPIAVAVSEASGDFYVLDETNGRVDRLGSRGEYLGEFDGSGVFESEGKEVLDGKPETGKLLEPRTIAVDNSCVHLKLSEPTCHSVDPSNGDVYVADGFEHKAIDKFSSVGEYIGQITVPLIKNGRPLEMMGVAVDDKGNLFVAEDQGLEHRGFDRFNHALANVYSGFIKTQGVRFAAEHSGLAVDSSDNLYVIKAFESPFGEVVSRFEPSGEELGVVTLRHTRGVALDSKSNNLYLDNVNSVSRFTPDIHAVEVERFGEGLLVDGRGLGVNSTIHIGEPDREGPVYAADAGAADVAAFPLEAPKSPSVEDASVSDVTSTSAILRATVNPRGAKTGYDFEYGACATSNSCESSPFEITLPATGEESVGAPLDFEAHVVIAHPQALKPRTTYHFRLVAQNEKSAPEEVAESKEIRWTTQPAQSPQNLLDHRGWEMVSQPHKHGTLILQIGEQDVIQASPRGDAFTYEAVTPTEDEPSGFSNFAQILVRRTKAGWISEDLNLSHHRATGQSIGQGQEYRLFSDDLSVALVQPFGEFEPATSSEASEQTPYTRTNLFGGSVETPCTTNCYQPLVTAGNVPEGVAFGESDSCPPHLICGPTVSGASPDGRHVIIRSPVGLTDISGDKGGLYEWTGGHLTLVSILPGPSGKPAPLANAPVLGGDVVTRGAVSTDGSRIVWSESKGKGLFLRNVDNGETVELNQGLLGTPEFQAASADGSRVFFTDDGDLYVYEESTGKAVRLTTPIEAGEQTGVQGKIVGTSEDGSYVYFVANGRLSGEGQEQAGTCQGTGSNEANRCYLYLLHEMSGVWGSPKLVAVLSGADFPDFSATLPDLTMRVSPSGRWLAFMSQMPLTGYDNRDAVSNARDEEVFLYDSSEDRLSCVSCNPTGARPNGIEYRRLIGGSVAGDRVWTSTTWLAANIPGWTPYKLGLSFYQSRYLLDDGRVFFNSSDSLAPSDVNGTEDVYEYEPTGVGKCTSADLSFTEMAQGCVGLVSSGTSGQESAFLDASASGSDIFFLTSSKLVSSDFDTALDVYDARECTVASPCLPEPPPPPLVCATETSCKSSPSSRPEVLGVPASAAFSGLGNALPIPAAPLSKASTHRSTLAKALSACRHHHPHSKKRRMTCERAVLHSRVRQG